ncbi:MAG: hypothetical protein M1834_001958 [Cirrosporium novae-zelandiae]|nr:MAG: hypothetical protein M1834_001958 [Cirrosporium novae-zelandiae]
MPIPRPTKQQRLYVAIALCTTFFVAEIYGQSACSVNPTAGLYLVQSPTTAGIKTRSLSLVADAFHYLSISEKDPPATLTFGWQRADLLGSHINGVFLLALGLSIFVQALGRFVNIERLTLEHASHSKNIPTSHGGHDHSVSVLLRHILSDLISSIGIIVGSAIIWFSKDDRRYYVDPAMSLVTVVLIFWMTLPLVRDTTILLLDSQPEEFVGLGPEIQQRIEQIPGLGKVHHIHIRHLTPKKLLATLHIRTKATNGEEMVGQQRQVREIFYDKGVQDTTIMMEWVGEEEVEEGCLVKYEESSVQEEGGDDQNLRHRGCC